MNLKNSPWQAEIILEDNLLDDEGNLLHTGFSRHPFLKYDRKRVKAKPSRIKEWDYYLIYNKNFGLALTVADNGYMGMLSATILDFKKPCEKTKSVITWFPMGKFNMPSSSLVGDVVYSNNKVSAKFEIVGKKRNLQFVFKNFKDKKDLIAKIELSCEPKESMVIATPFDKPKHFYYNQKIIGFKAQGTVCLGEDEIMQFNEDNSRGILDWGRGVWPYKNTWYWGAACGDYDGHELGFNIGYGFGNTKSGTENMIFYDGVAHKLEHINIEISSLNKKNERYMLPWKITSSDGRFEMDFIPIIDRFSNTDIGIIGSNQHQVFGVYTGKLVLDNGKEINIKNFLGFAEKVVNKW